MDDNIAPILLRHLIERDQVDGTVDTTNAEVRATEVDVLEGRDWLLTYRAHDQPRTTRQWDWGLSHADRATQHTGTSSTGDDEEVDDGGEGGDEAGLDDFEPDVPPRDEYYAAALDRGVPVCQRCVRHHNLVLVYDSPHGAIARTERNLSTEDTDTAQVASMLLDLRNRSSLSGRRRTAGQPARGVLRG